MPRNLMTYAPPPFLRLRVRDEREGNFAKFSALFFNFKVGDEILGFEMFKEFEDDVSGALALFLVGAVHLALGEKVVKGNGRFQLF